LFKFFYLICRNNKNFFFTVNQNNSKKKVFVVPTDKIEKFKQCFQGRHFEKSKDIIISSNTLKQIKLCVKTKLRTNELRLETSTEIETNEISSNIENKYSELEKLLIFTGNKVLYSIILLFFSIAGLIIILDDISTFIPQIIAILILVLSIIG
jgi:hypothetical protein